MQDHAGEMTDAVLSQVLGTGWRVLGDLAKRADTEPKLHLLQQLFAKRDVTSWDRGGNRCPIGFLYLQPGHPRQPAKLAGYLQGTNILALYAYSSSSICSRHLA